MRVPRSQIEIQFFEHERKLKEQIGRLKAIGDGLDSLIFEPPDHKTDESGIIICGGGELYLVNAYVLIALLRRLGCGLPIQLWYLGQREYIPALFDQIRKYDVQFLDAMLEGFKRVPIDGKRCIDGNIYRGAMGDGFALKSFAAVKSRFAKVIELDADCLPYYNPETLLQEERSQFWIDGPHRILAPEIWETLIGKPAKAVEEWESGQMVIDCKRDWHVLNVANYLNEQREIIYDYLYGDKDTFHVAWRRFNYSFKLPPRSMAYLKTELGQVKGHLQFDKQCKPVFEHRVRDGKWSLYGVNDDLGHPYHQFNLESVEYLKRVI